MRTMQPARSLAWAWSIRRATRRRREKIVAPSFEPIIQRAFGPFSKVAFKAALAAQPGKITGPRSGNDKPRRLDLAVLDDFRPLQHECALASTQCAAESLHADEAGGFVIASDLQRSNR